MTKHALILALTAALLGPAVAQVDPSAKVAQQIKANYPKTQFKMVRKAEIAGLYEVVMGDSIAYTDETARYFLFGHLFDMKEQVDLTAQRRAASVRIEFPFDFLDNALVMVKGDGRARVAVFSDPDCPYCRQMEGELARLNNVTIYTFLYPIGSLHPGARAKAVSVWCATNRNQAWSDLMLAGKPPKPADCPNPIDHNQALGARLGIVGTPTLIAEDGRVHAGLAPAEKIAQWLNATDTSQSTAAHKEPAR